MARVLLFNPENDVRLGEMPGRTPRKLTQNVIALGCDGALLPLWWADEEDYILVRNIPVCRHESVRLQAEEMKRKFGLCGSVIFEGEKVCTDSIGMPWGWSYDSAAMLTAVGAECPSEAEIQNIRQLSHRRTASVIAKKLATMLPFAIPSPAVECGCIEKVDDFVEQHGEAYVKTPWSSSGRGVIRLSGRPGDRERQLIVSAIRRQGSVMCEQALCGLQDFAMLFYAEGGRAEYRGLSVFETNGSAAYSGNIVDSEEQLEAVLLQSGADSDELNAVRQSLECVLTEIVAPYYTGWMGVDMLVMGNGGIAPCIELNLRMTMGVVAWMLARRLPVAEKPGRYTVAYRSDPADAISLTGNYQDATFSFQYRKNM